MNLNTLPRTTFVVIAAVLALTLSACSGGSDAKPAEGGASASTVGEDEEELENGDIKTYFEAVVSGDPDKLSSANELAAPGSLAEAYLKYHEAGAEANIDGGTPIEASDLKKVKTGYENCSNPDEPTDCVTWAEFESEGDKLAAFTINGESLDSRISLGNGKAVDAGRLGTVEFLVAYQSVQSGDLFVIARITSKDQPVAINSGSANYRGTDKRQSQNSAYYGVADLGADSTGSLAMVFTRAKPGGEVTLTLNSEDFMTSENVKFKTR